MTSRSPFTMTLLEASDHVRRHADDSSDDDKERRRCYLLQLLLRPVYGGGPLLPNVHRHLPRVVNGIPLMAGVATTKDGMLRWRYVEAGDGNLAMFLSDPMTSCEAETARTLLQDTLATNGDEVFGDEVVRATVVLSECLRFDCAVFVNDIAQPHAQGLHFR